MRTILCLMLTCFSCFGAGYRIFDLDRTNTVGGPELLELSQGGVKSWAITAANLFKALGTNNNTSIINVTTNTSVFNITSNLYATNIWATNIYIAGTVVNDWTFTTNFYTINNYSSNIFASWEYVTNLYVTTNYTYFSYITNLYDQRAYITTNINDYTYTTNLYVTNLYVQNFYATNPAQFGSNIYVSGFVFAGWVVVTNYVQADTIYIGDLFVTNCPPATNYTTVLSGTNTYVELTTTNNTNFYAVNAANGIVNVTNFGIIVTNVPYTSNFITDLSYVQNDYYMTNMMNNHICVYPTNMFSGLAWTMSLVGTNIYTNWNVYFTWPPSVTVTWLSITNGLTVSTVTSNKVQFYSFKCRASSTTTNVIAAYKEQP